MVNPRSFTTSYGYDPLYRRITKFDAYGNALQRTLTVVYDAVDNLLSSTNGLGVTTSFGYDALNRPFKRLDAYGTSLQRTTTATLDADNNVIAVIDPLGFTTSASYDALNRLISLTNPDGGVATAAYDANNNIVSLTDQLKNIDTYAYDALNRVAQSTSALGGLVTLTYDPNDNLLNVTDPVGNLTQWLYDALDRKVQETDPRSNSSTYAYDAVDRATSITDRNSQRIAFNYDLLNREIGEAWLNASATTVGLLTFTFDPNDNLLTFAAPVSGTLTLPNTTTLTYDALDRLSTVQDAFGTLLTNTYDAADNRTMVQDLLGGLATRTFDVLSRLVTMSFSGQSQTLREDFGYTVRDQVANQWRYSNLTGTTTIGYSTFTYDAVGRLTNLQHLNGTLGAIANFTNAYDLASRIISETLNGTTPTSYQYDATAELTNDSDATYTYDLNGNRTMTGYATGLANQTTSDGTWDYVYDKNGNLIQKINISTGELVVYGYDNRNRLVAVSDTTSAGLQIQGTYVYDALGQRIERDVLTGGIATTTRSAYYGGQIWADMNGSNAIQTRYLRTDRALELLASVSGGGTAAWMLVDRMGSVRNVVNSAGVALDTITYDGFGNATQTSGANGGPYLWNGYRYDTETGLFRPDPTQGRVYTPTVGRWTCPDPIGFRGGDVNLYRYIGNNPTNLTDPNGLRSRQDFALPPSKPSLADQLFLPNLLSISNPYYRARLTLLRIQADKLALLGEKIVKLGLKADSCLAEARRLNGQLILVPFNRRKEILDMMAQQMKDYKAAKAELWALLAEYSELYLDIKERQRLLRVSGLVGDFPRFPPEWLQIPIGYE
jgi:RHS repeat-associated protein